MTAILRVAGMTIGIQIPFSVPGIYRGSHRDIASGQILAERRIGMFENTETGIKLGISLQLRVPAQFGRLMKSPPFIMHREGFIFNTGKNIRYGLGED